jgi:hypothetical protein
MVLDSNNRTNGDRNKVETPASGNKGCRSIVLKDGQIKNTRLIERERKCYNEQFTKYA